MHDRRTFMQSRAFTIVELLVVVAIIAILIGIAITVGTRVTSGSKARQTADVIRVLDSMLNEFQASQGATPGPTALHPSPTNKNNAQMVVIVDGVASVAQPKDKPLDTVAWFLVQMQESPSAAAMIKSLPSKSLQPSFRFPAGDPLAGRPQSYIDVIDDNVTFNTVLDAWGRPIRYVHPATDAQYDRDVYDAGQPLNGLIDRAAGKGKSYAPLNGKLTRSSTNSDAGICPGNSAYFYSCGPDGDPSTIDDNVYTVVPTRAAN